MSIIILFEMGFWVAILALLQTFVLYPVELFVVNAVWPEDDEEETKARPSVTLVIAAYNEEEIIADKIGNSLELDYPKEKLDMVVFSDASSDHTDEIVREYEDEGVELMRIEGRVGKTACQNRVVESLSTDVIIFSDANSMYDPAAIERLVEGFEEGVGCVVGELRYEGCGVEGERLYWRYERLLKCLESTFNTLVTGNGAIYAVRRSSYVPLPDDAISDFAEPLAIIKNGERVTYASDAVAYEYTEESVTSELDRRVRIVSRSWNTLEDNIALLNPLRYPIFSFQLLSHKVLRWLAPFWLAAALFTNVVLATTGSLVYVLLLAGQLGCYVLAAGGAVLNRTNRHVPMVFHAPYYFVASNYGMLLGLLAFVRNGAVVTWETTDRNDQAD